MKQFTKKERNAIYKMILPLISLENDWVCLIAERFLPITERFCEGKGIQVKQLLPELEWFSANDSLCWLTEIDKNNHLVMSKKRTIETKKIILEFCVEITN